MPEAVIANLTDELQVWQVRAFWQGGQFDQGESSWSFVTAREFGVPQAEMYADWQAFLEPLFCTARPENWALFEVKVEDRWPGTASPLIVSYGGSGLQPDSSGTPAAPQIGPIITWFTGLPGRSFRGRTYWGSMRESDRSTWAVTGDAAAAADAFAAAMISTFNPPVPSGHARFAIISRTENGVLRDPPVFTLPTVGATQPYLTTMRRRAMAPRFL